MKEMVCPTDAVYFSAFLKLILFLIIGTFKFSDAMETDSKDTDSNVSRIIHEEVTYEEWRDNMITRAKAILNAKNT